MNRRNNSKGKVCLTVDLEFLNQKSLSESKTKAESFDLDQDEIVENLLSLLDETDSKVTFFVVASLVEENPGLVERISDKGHEIASHALTHKNLREMTKEEMRDEIGESKRILEEKINEEVLGFRAPGLKILGDKVFYQLLDEFNYKYSSSKIPSLPIPGWYGDLSIPMKPFRISEFYDFEVDNRIFEVPVSVNPFLRLPFSGNWLRLLGHNYFYWSLDKLIEKDIIPVFYIHPWELMDLSAVSNLPIRNKIRSGTWLFNKIRKVCERYEIDSVRNILDINKNKD
ncbi:hypothetical protein C9439_04040 [archaeon SCG-AAA382B04]|nr:hypothetical protein C9439_04040 [archaeon SCG-AAA382B04]